MFVSERSNKAHWIEAGRGNERFTLQVTALAIYNAMLNQPVEIEAARPQFATCLGLGADHRPDMVVRFARGSRMALSMGPPVRDVLR